MQRDGRRQKIVPCLWFDDQAEDAVAHYTAIFPDSRVLSVTRYGESGPRPKGMVLTITFQLAGQEFMALNGGPEFRFSEAVSLSVNCETQAELDEYWRRLSEGGEPGPCGWLKDRYGLSWQIVPTLVGEMLQDPDAAKSDRVMRAILGMGKLDIEGLRRAYEGE